MAAILLLTALAASARSSRATLVLATGALTLLAAHAAHASHYAHHHRLHRLHLLLLLLLAGAAVLAAALHEGILGHRLAAAVVSLSHHLLELAVHVGWILSYAHAAAVRAGGCHPTEANGQT